MLEIQKTLTLSTAHVKDSTREMLTKAALYHPMTGRSYDWSGIIPYAKTSDDLRDPYGWFIYINPDCFDEGGDPMPGDLRMCVAFALMQGCTLLILDGDGPIAPQLPIYEGEAVMKRWFQQAVNSDESNSIYANLVELAAKYGFLIVSECDGEGENASIVAFSLFANDTDGETVEWFGYNPASEVVKICGNTDQCNIWLHETRPDFTPEKCIQFVSELHDLFDLEEDMGSFLRKLIDPEDWQEIAGIRDAYEDKRYNA